MSSSFSPKSISRQQAPSKALLTAQRALAGQQIGYFCLMARILSGMAHHLPWSDLRKPDRKRAGAMLARLEHDIGLARLILREGDTHKRSLFPTELPPYERSR